MSTLNIIKDAESSFSLIIREEGKEVGHETLENGYKDIVVILIDTPEVKVVECDFTHGNHSVILDFPYLIQYTITEFEDGLISFDFDKLLDK